MWKQQIKWKLGEVLCRLGRHKAAPYYEDAHGWHGGDRGDCERCGIGPLS